MPHRILTTNPTTGERGIYLEGEIAGLAAPLWIAKTSFPTLRGPAAQRIANLEADLAVLLDAAMPPATTQRIRVHVFSLVPDEYVIGVFASPADITPTWWGD
jgi:hypothetical protein